jgi:hypothetical protein
MNMFVRGFEDVLWCSAVTGPDAEETAESFIGQAFRCLAWHASSVELVALTVSVISIRLEQLISRGHALRDQQRSKVNGQ